MFRFVSFVFHAAMTIQKLYFQFYYLVLIFLSAAESRSWQVLAHGRGRERIDVHIILFRESAHSLCKFQKLPFMRYVAHRE